MKNLLFIVTIALLSGTSLAQDKIGSYEMKYFSKSFDISAGSNGDFYIQATNLDSKDGDAGLIVDKKDVEGFKATLNAAKEKFTEWSEVATQNGVTELSKEIPVNGKSMSYYWAYGSKVRFSFNRSLTYKFVIFEKSGKHVLLLTSGELVASDNQFMKTPGIALAFESAIEVEALAKSIDPVAAATHFESKAKDKDLFK